MYCWGAGMQGELGTGGTQDSNVPLAVANMDSGVSVTSAGYAHTCAVRSGKAFCWGNNNRGQLGNGTQSQFEVLPTPVATQKGTAVVTMTNGTYHGCFTTTTGSVFCWGSNEFGAIGLDSTIPFSPNPVQISFGTPTASSEVSAGAFTSCAWGAFPLVEDDGGGAFCWGQGTSGQLGNGQFEHNRIPQRVLNIGRGNQVVETQ
jgi:alpha-tubulin suppressor-like RCC1 family protein